MKSTTENKLTKKKISKKTIIIIISISVAAILLFSMLGKKSTVNANGDAELTTLTLDSFYNTITVSGDVASDSTTDVYSSLSNYTFAVIEVEVGDTVKIGDTLAVLDTDTLEESIYKKELAISEATKQNEQSIKAAEDNYNNLRSAIDNGTNTSIFTAKNNMTSAQEKYNDAKTAYDDKKSEMENNSILIALDDEVLAKEQLLQTAESEKNTANTNYQSALSINQPIIDDTTGIYSDADKQSAQAAIDSAKNELDSKEQAETLAKTALETAKTNRDNGYLADQTILDSLLQTLNTTKTAYDNSVVSYNSSVSSAENSAESAYNTLQSTILKADQTADYYDLALLYDDLEAATIKATQNGVVTAVNASVGGNATGVLFTVQNTDSLIVETTIKDFDLNTIEVGMKALIDSNATGDKIYNGEVVSIAPSPNQATASESDTGYSVKIKILNPDDNLHIGMSMSIDLVVDEQTDVISVPYDAIYQDDNGDSFVFINDKDDEVSQIAVNIDAENDFEAIISGSGIYEGVVIISDANSYLNTEMKSATNAGGMQGFLNRG